MGCSQWSCTWSHSTHTHTYTHPPPSVGLPTGCGKLRAQPHQARVPGLACCHDAHEDRGGQDGDHRVRRGHQRGYCLQLAVCAWVCRDAPSSSVNSAPSAGCQFHGDGALPPSPRLGHLLPLPVCVCVCVCVSHDFMAPKGALK